MIELFKDRYKISLFLAVLFFLGIIGSVYNIYSLPYNLRLTEGYQPALMNVYITIGTTFLIGALTIWQALLYKNEVVVYRDKQLETNVAEKDSTNASQTTISLEEVKTSLRQARNEKEILHSSLQAICKQLEAGQGAIYVTTTHGELRKLELKSGYALSIGESATISYEFGEGLVGQSASGVQTLYVDDIPEGYVKIISGLGSASPRYLLIVPMKKNDSVLGVMEIASFTPISDDQRKFVEESAQLVVDKLSNN